MSENKTGKSSWTPEQKQLYRERREHGVRGQVGYVNIHQTMIDEDGQEQRIPVSFMRGPGFSSRLGRKLGKMIDRTGSAKNLATRKRRPWLQRIEDSNKSLNLKGKK